ncbi:MAG: fimbrillin family protein [Alistipes sp.]|nr:fimbrillin family protein [Alistipes sp.]
MKNFFATAAVCAAMTVVLASCDNNNVVLQGPQPVKFSATVGEASATPATRAYDTAWENGDEIGIFMVGNGTSTVVDNTNNRQFKTEEGDGVFAAVAANQTIYYPTDDSEVDFIAYYPYKAGTAIDGNVSVSITTQTTPKDIDMLWAKANNSGAGYSKGSSGAVALQFSHVLSKLVMNVIPGDGLEADDLEDMSVAIRNMYTGAAFNVGTGVVNGFSNPLDFEPRQVTNGAKYDAIVLPTTYGAGEVMVQFTLDGGDVFVWNLTDTQATFASGSQYTYDVTLNRTGVTVTGDITAWTPVVGGDVTAQ